MHENAEMHLSRLGQLASKRTDFESYWRQVQEVAAPDAPDFTMSGYGPGPANNVYNSASAARRSTKIFDSTAVWAVDRLASGLEGLIIPQSDRWHNLAVDDVYSMDNDATDEEKVWLEAVRDFMFRVRYDSQSGWSTALQTAFRRMVAFGNAFVFIEEGPGRNLIRYRHLPLNECYVAEDSYGQIDTFYRVYSLTARQAVQRFGDAVSSDIKTAAQDLAKRDQEFRFLHAICPRTDYKTDAMGVMGAPWQSLQIEADKKLVVGESGYFEFPVVDFRWLPEPQKIYGEGPIMRVLADIQSMQLMAKNEMVASQQAVRPPLLLRRHGIINQPNTNPGATILGGVDEQGRPAIQPLNLGTRIDFAQQVIQAKRENLRESLYINLFATMRDDPRMSATEALIKANEKGELLGPAGSRIQESLSRMVQRELGILSRKGLFNEDSVFVPPETLQGKEIGPKFASPLDRIRRAKDAEATIRTLEIITPIAQTDPTIFEHFDQNEMTRGLAEVLGMPRRWMRTREDVDDMRAERAAQEQQMMQLQQAQQAASAAKDAAPALETMMKLGAGDGGGEAG